MKNSFLAAMKGLISGSAIMLAAPAEAQLKQDFTVNFDLENIKNPPVGPTLSLTKPFDKKGDHAISLQIGERPLSDFERNRPLLSRECGQGCEAKVKWMKLQATFKFGGPK